MILDVKKVMLASAEKKLNWKDLRDLSHISSVTLQRIKTGKAVNMKTAGKLAEVLGVTVADLIKV